MISISTDVNKLWDNLDNETVFFIYGAGTNAEAFLDLLSKTDIRLNGLIDQNKSKIGHLFKGYPIYSLEDIKTNFKNKKIRILISIYDVYGSIMNIESALDDATVFVAPNSEGGFNMLFTPIRNRLIKDKNFTLIANTCMGVRTYQLTGCKFNSPFIAVIISPEDYLKICSNLKTYMAQELKFVNYEEWKFNDKYQTLCQLGDTKIKFIGKTDFDEVKEKWDKRVKRINYKNLFFMWENTHYPVPANIYNKFLEIPYGTKLIIQRETHIPCKHTVLTTRDIHFFSNYFIEKWFDLTGFLNHEVEY